MVLVHWSELAQRNASTGRAQAEISKITETRTLGGTAIRG